MTRGTSTWSRPPARVHGPTAATTACWSGRGPGADPHRPRTPCGEYFRRFWLPVAMTEELGEHPHPRHRARRGARAVPGTSPGGSPAAQALQPPPGVARVRDRLRARGPVLLSRLAVRRGRHDPRGAGEPAESPIPRRLQPRRLSRRRAGRPRLRLPWPPRSEARVPDARHPRPARRRAGALRDRLPLQLVAGGRESDGSVPQRVPAHAGHPARTSTRRGGRCRWSSGTRTRTAPGSISPTSAAGRTSSGCAPPRSCSRPSRSRRTSTRTRIGRSSFPGSGSPSGRCRLTTPGAGSSASATSATSLTSTARAIARGSGSTRSTSSGRPASSAPGRRPCVRRATTRPKFRKAPSRFTPASGSRPPTRGWLSTGGCCATRSARSRRAMSRRSSGRDRDGQVPTMAGDVIVRVPASNTDDDELQRTMGRAVGRIVHETMDLERTARRAEIERRVRRWVGARDQAGAP